MSRTQYTIGIDVGGTRTRVGLCDAEGSLIAQRKLRTLPEPEAMLPQIVGAIQECLGEQGVSWDDLVGIGLSVAGTVHVGTERVGKAPNLPQWEGFAPGEALQALLRDQGVRDDLPVVVDNDANAAAWGIARWEAPQLENLVYVTISTGIGGGIVIGRKLYHGGGGSAAEVGHMILKPGGPRCPCGKLGCWEALASGTAIAREGRARLGDPQITTPQVFQLAHEGNREAQKILDEVAEYLGLGFANLTELLDPETIFLGGGVMNEWEQLQTPALASYGRNARWRVPIRSTRLGDEVGLLGAAALVGDRD